MIVFGTIFLFSFPCPFLNFFFQLRSITRPIIFVRVRVRARYTRVRLCIRTCACACMYACGTCTCTCTCICICICICTERERILKNLLSSYISTKEIVLRVKILITIIYVQRISEWYNVVTTNLAGRSARYGSQPSPMCTKFDMYDTACERWKAFTPEQQRIRSTILFKMEERSDSNPDLTGSRFSQQERRVL